MARGKPWTRRDKELVTELLHGQVTLTYNHFSTSRRAMVTKLERRKVKTEPMGHLDHVTLKNTDFSSYGKSAATTLEHQVHLSKGSLGANPNVIAT